MWLEFDVSANDISHVTMSSGRFPYVEDSATNDVGFRIQRALDHTGTTSTGLGVYDTFTIDSSNIAHFDPSRFSGYVSQSGWSGRKWSNVDPSA